MKFFTLLFTFYFLALAVKPCSDKEDCIYGSAGQSSLATTDHSDHENDTENCSPVCVCSCCGQTCNFTQFQAYLGLNFPTSVEKIDLYNSSFVSEVFTSIWQPPKI